MPPSVEGRGRSAKSQGPDCRYCTPGRHKRSDDANQFATRSVSGPAWLDIMRIWPASLVLSILLLAPVYCKAITRQGILLLAREQMVLEASSAVRSDS